MTAKRRKENGTPTQLYRMTTTWPVVVDGTRSPYPKEQKKKKCQRKPK